jgi:hypothetical protein
MQRMQLPLPAFRHTVLQEVVDLADVIPARNEDQYRASSRVIHWITALARTGATTTTTTTATTAATTSTSTSTSDRVSAMNVQH